MVGQSEPKIIARTFIGDNVPDVPRSVTQIVLRVKLIAPLNKPMPLVFVSQVHMALRTIVRFNAV